MLAEKKDFLPVPLEARPPGAENRPTGPVTPPRAQRRGWGTPAPAPGAQNRQPPRAPPPASRSTLAATMALPRAPARPQVPKPPAWRQNYRAAAGWACSALKIVQKCPHC